MSVKGDNTFKRYKVRFNLRRGSSYYKKWQIIDKVTKSVFHISPDIFSLTLVDCKLRNQKATAKKINEGQNKTPCAWIDCNDVILNDVSPSSNKQICYDPRVRPNWFDGETSQDIDNQCFAILETWNNKVFFKKDK